MLPLACLVMVGLVRSFKNRSRESAIAFSQSLAWFGVWSILWLSGKNMGEAARLWIFLAPWPVMTAAIALSKKRFLAPENLSQAVRARGSRWPTGLERAAGDAIDSLCVDDVERGRISFRRVDAEMSDSPDGDARDSRAGMHYHAGQLLLA